jgi:hypothetical protein
LGLRRIRQRHGYKPGSGNVRDRVKRKMTFKHWTLGRGFGVESPYRPVVFQQSKENMIAPFATDLKVAARTALFLEPQLTQEPA